MPTPCALWDSTKVLVLDPFIASDLGLPGPSELNARVQPKRSEHMRDKGCLYEDTAGNRKSPDAKRDTYCMMPWFRISIELPSPLRPEGKHPRSTAEGLPTLPSLCSSVRLNATAWPGWLGG